MEKTKEPIVHYCLCGAAHPGEQLKRGWYAIYKTNKRVGIERVICPACLERMRIKGNQN
jgi:hypothetical protein